MECYVASSRESDDHGAWTCYCPWLYLKTCGYEEVCEERDVKRSVKEEEEGEEVREKVCVK